MELLDGKKYRNELEALYKEEIKDNNLSIGLAIIQVGNSPESNTYIKNKINFCNKVGITVYLYQLDESSNEEVISIIEKFNKDGKVTGIILQSPTKGVDFDKCVEHIDESKDVDGLTSGNRLKLERGEESILPCTVKGIIKLLEHYKIKIKGSNVVILGRGKLVGKPLADLLRNMGSNVTVCHSKTEDVSKYTKEADIVVGAMGNPKYIKKDMLKEGFIGIDAGTTYIDGKQVGDFDFDNVKDMSSYITPPIGGVGPMTVAMIVDNLIEMKKRIG